jgi:ABC-type amino acid transport substrate-binding protein
VTRERVDQTLRSDFAPTGTLRAAINLGNPILAGTDPRTGNPCGVSVDIAHSLATRLALPLELVVVDGASKSVDAVASEQADVGFFAIDPMRAAAIAFTEPYVLIEGCYLVHQDSSLRVNDEVDAPGLTVAVGRGSAYDLYLTRAFVHASIVRAPTSSAVVDTFIQQRLDVAAGVKQHLDSDAQRVGGLRLLPGRFMVIKQAMAIPQSRGQHAAEYLARYAEELKATGFIQRCLDRNGIVGASVAGPGGQTH